MKAAIAFLFLAGVALAAASPSHSPYKWNKASPIPDRKLRSRNLAVNPLLKHRAHTNRQTPANLPRSANADPNCGVENAGSGRIVGGQEALPNQFPWLAVVICESSGTLCTGSFISDSWVMTAGHCVDGCGTFEIQAGAHDYTDDFEDGKITITSHTYVIHPAYDNEAFHDDIGLIALPEPLPLANSKYGTVCLPSYSDVTVTYAGEMTTAAGWGWTSDNPITPGLKVNFVRDIPVMENADCYLYYGDIITDGHLCVDTHGSHGTCFGDSGGPLMWYDAAGQATAIGINSFVSSAGCSAELPDGTTRVTAYLEFIEDSTGIVINP